MDLTSQVLRDVEFRETWKGYNQSDVDAFLDEVAAGVDVLHARIRELQDRTVQPVAAAASAQNDDTVKRTLQLAQRAADLVVSEAKGVAARTVEEANAQAARLTADAEQVAQKRVAEADAEAKRTVDMHIQAADTAHAERRNQLEAQRLELEREVQERRAELEHLRFLVTTARDNVRAALTDHLTRVDALTTLVPEASAAR
jgi:cell division initiation protein